MPYKLDDYYHLGKKLKIKFIVQEGRITAGPFAYFTLYGRALTIVEGMNE